MNQFNCIGRLTRDPEVTYTQGETPKAIAKFAIAIDRQFKREGQQGADFINCVSFGKTAEFVEKYFSKGMKVGLTGRIQPGSYTNKDGIKVYTTDLVVERVYFCERKGDSQQDNQQPQNDDFMSVPEGMDGFPFN